MDAKELLERYAAGERDFQNVDLRGANLNAASLSEVILRGADLREADLRGAMLFKADLCGADLRGANLFGATLHGANLSEAKLHRADLRYADLRDADLRNANNLGTLALFGADLRGAKLSGQATQNANWHKAHTDGPQNAVGQGSGSAFGSGTTQGQGNLLGSNQTQPHPSDDKSARFSSIYPKEVLPFVWVPFRVYVFHESARHDVEIDAARWAEAQSGNFRSVAEGARRPIAEGALITATPALPGFQFNPPSASIAFYEEWHGIDFRLRAATARSEHAANGRITLTVEGVIVADLPMSVFVSTSAGTMVSAPARAHASPYEAVFCSYSHKDTRVVERVERACKVLGLTYLRDVTTLRSGEKWNARLLEMIEQADIFQLFWSSSAKNSRNVTQEWKHALSLGRSGAFIRPVYWEDPMPRPPRALESLHFTKDEDLSK